MVVCLNDSMVEINKCGLEMTLWYKEIRQLDNSQKYINDRLAFALCSLDKCRQQHLFLSKQHNKSTAATHVFVETK